MTFKVGDKVRFKGEWHITNPDSEYMSQGTVGEIVAIRFTHQIYLKFSDTVHPPSLESVPFEDDIERGNPKGVYYRTHRYNLEKVKR